MSLAAADFDYLRTLMKNHTAIVLDAGKEYLAETRLAPFLGEQKCSSVQELLTLLRRQNFNVLHRRVLDAMTNNETWFFRDLYPFEALKATILPQIISRPDSARSLSIWSAACSSGQEIYSVAMLIRENFPSLLNLNITLLGTDISDAILQRAEAGRYSQLEVNRGLPAILLAKYFQQEGRDWQLKRNVRDMARFRFVNLSSPFPHLGPFDVVFLRNVLIYFAMDVRREILARIRHALRPGGVLFLGSAETTLNLDDSYERVPFQKTFYYRPKP
jgi:chemotaxis protein methyltransferase CheR